MATEIENNCGIVDLANGFRFVWMRAKDGEVSGFVENADRSIVKGSNGWYRTNDAAVAARIAEANLNS